MGRYRKHRRNRLSAGFAFALAALCVTFARAGTLSIGSLSFSDELGGFRLISVSGSGSTADPIVIVEEITGSGPAVLVIRGLGKQSHGGDAIVPGFSVNLALVKIVLNGSRNPWSGFDLELREMIRKPSPYGDGLSFDQLETFGRPTLSDRFAASRLQHEPFDRVSFRNGTVDTGTVARFDFFITDPTPVPEFYLVQRPMVLIAEGPPSLAALSP